MGPDTEKPAITQVQMQDIVEKIMAKERESVAKNRERLDKAAAFLQTVVEALNTSSELNSIFAVIETDTVFHTIQISDNDPSPAAVNNLRMLSLAAEQQALKRYAIAYKNVENE